MFLFDALEHGLLGFWVWKFTTFEVTTFVVVFLAVFFIVFLDYRGMAACES